jgi:dUTPase
MTVIAADGLDPKKFFKKGKAVAQGSSFDLTIGCIFDHAGKRIHGPFTLKPGHIVQVASAEVFDLPASVTGHVTYKTTLTQKGIWALTVGIVDPGWNGPVSTTLLNFSRADYPIAEGDAFLRVTLFEHAPVASAQLRKAPPLQEYLKNVQKSAASLFPPTFLNSEEIAGEAGRKVMDQIRNQALAWIAGIAIIFTILQFVADFASLKLSAPSTSGGPQISQEDVNRLHRELASIKDELEKLKTTAAYDGASLGKPEVPVIPK